MAIEFIIYIIAAMVIWDFTNHIDDLLLNRKKITRPLHPISARKFFDYLAKGDENKRWRFYNIF